MHIGVVRKQKNANHKECNIKRLRMIIAVDYDDTLVISGKPNKILIEKLIQEQTMGNPIILNTCRSGKRLQEAISLCGKHGLVFQAINDNLPQVIQHFGNNPRKIYADLYIDDKAIRP